MQLVYSTKAVKSGEVPMNKFVVSVPTLPPFEDYVAEIRDIWESHILTHQGEKYHELERQLTKYLGVKDLLLFANGHLSLQLALRLFDFNGGEVITTPFTFSSTTQAILEAGMAPVFCDIDEMTFTLDPAKIENCITGQTKAIVPVHVFGQPCKVKEIQALADKYNLKTIYDSAHTFGVTVDGAGIGNFGDLSMFSFHATKVFNTVEGGALTFSNHEYREKLVALRQYGQRGNSYPFIGTNAKLSEFHAAMGLCNLRSIDASINKRKSIAETYCTVLQAVEGIRVFTPSDAVRSNYSYFPILVESSFPLSRDTVADFLREQGVLTRKYFSPLTSSFDCCRNIGRNTGTPIAEYVEQHVLCLPLHTEMEITDALMIAELLSNTK
jgi:dTDP-4-amino-4,6-dideoxygalactose transaminase